MLYTAASKDGDIKVWDAISAKCITTFRLAHQGQQVTSVCFARNSKVLTLSFCLSLFFSGQWLLAYCYSQLPGTIGLSNSGLG